VRLHGVSTDDSRKCRVLLADDDAAIRRLQRLTLERDGRFEVVAEAADGVEAIFMSGRERPDAVILDVAMPTMSGLEALPVIRRMLGDRIVVVCSSSSSASVPSEVRRLGATFLPKMELAALARKLGRQWSQGRPAKNRAANLADPSELRRASSLRAPTCRRGYV
jgi:CheY-like chemotaxis protein